MTLQEMKNLSEVEQKALYEKLKEARSISKTVNFSSIYGIGAPKLSKTLKITVPEAKKLLNAYWKRNKAVKDVENSITMKEVNGQFWIYNPVSKMWVFLKAKKDIFSSLNQNTGSYVFNVWLKFTRELLEPLGVTIPLEYHDELCGICKKELKTVVEKRLQIAMDRTNEMLKLNVKIKFSVEWGSNYAEVH